MLFNSIDFIIYLPIVFFIYWFIVNKNIKLQNSFIVLASYVFYGWWDWRFLALIIFSTVLDYIIGLVLKKEDNRLKRKLFVWTSVIFNLGFLLFFKYYNFFVDNFISAFSFFGLKFHYNTLNIILPVGISFYTFQTLSYTIDVYKRKMEPTTNFIAFAAFVSFFPQLVAGPIERAKNLLPQFNKMRHFDYSEAVNGLRLILWGLFKKVVVADTCASYVNEIFANYSNYSGSTLLLGSILFAFQIYGDFSGYSYIAIGTARLFGFKLMNNFFYPYFSRDIAEFWRRWHISLSTWFRDYLYIPLGGSKGNRIMKIRNVFIIFIVSGFWHGANWTFIIWGALNALYFIPLLVLERNRLNIDNIAEDRRFPPFRVLIQMVSTFLLTTFAWIFFRSESLADAIYYIKGLGQNFFSFPEIFPLKTLLFIFVLILIEWVRRKTPFPLSDLNQFIRNKSIRYAFYFSLIYLIIFFGLENQRQFIYFQF